MTEHKRTNDPTGLRRRIIEVAFRAFTTRGYNATSVHDVRRDAGVTGGAYSHHFPTKKSLALAVMDQCVAEAVDAAWLRPVAEAPSAIEGIGQAFAGIVAELDRKRSIAGCPLGNMAIEAAGQDAEMREAAAALFARWTDCLAAKMRADGRAGHARYRDPDTLAAFVVAAYSGAMVMAKASQSTVPLKECAIRIEAHLVRCADL